MNPNEVKNIPDEKWSIDYVLVINRSILNSNLKINWLETYMQNLQSFGFQYERKEFVWDRNVEFILLHLQENNILEIYEAYKIEMTKNSEIYKFTQIKWKYFKNFLLKPDKLKPLYLRAPELFDGDKPETLTPAERIHAISFILKRNLYGRGPYEFGLENLKKAGVLDCAYPLHDGDHHWTESGPLTRRQLLFEFWARPKRWYQMQPSNLIESYLGTDYAFQYDWLGVYTAMLIIPSITSIVVILYGVATISSTDHPEANTVCKSNKLICPTCSMCKYYYLRETCVFENWSHVLSNTGTNVFAILISIWSTFVYSLWNRIEIMNELKWNVKFMEKDMTMRPEYKYTAYYREERNGRLEPYVPFYSFFIHTLFSTFVIVGLIGFTVWVQLYIRIFRMQFTMWLDKEFTTSPYESASRVESIASQFLSAIIIALFTLIYQKIYYRISYKLTKIENPRTQWEFMVSYCYKCYIIDIINFYTSLFLTGFFEITSDPTEEFSSLLYETFREGCISLNCVLESVILQFTIWFIRSIWKLVAKLIYPKIYLHFRKRKYQNKYIGLTRMDDLSQWEKDFLLETPEKLQVVHAMLDELVEYGFVSYFISVFPLAPLCAFLTNVIHLRIEAYRTVAYRRRPQSIKINKVVNWSFLLKCTTYIGIFTNAIFICFTGNFVHHTFEKLNANYIADEYSFLKINTSKVISYYNYTVKEDYCYYKMVGRTDNRFFVIIKSYTALFFLIVLHLVFLIKGLASFIISPIPPSVLAEAARHQKEKRKEKIRTLENTVLLELKEETRVRFDLKKKH
ncbi:unnamed protein product [Brassicogethes aeneus]|uniref:Anoctamin n=1 Tax=Brassicogethes aeneus TaxID=1431903 RepID=A0A9P0FC82_BRAAE|nr:unnamed protein product [Brassicogethes aeneus]